jgi:Na+/proline symporter
MSFRSLKNLAPPMKLDAIQMIMPSGTKLHQTPSDDNTASHSYHMNNKFGNMLLMFVITMVVFWVLLYTFNPKIVQSRYITSDGNGNTKTLPDAGRCFIGSLILSALITLVLWFMNSHK